MKEQSSRWNIIRGLIFDLTNIQLRIRDFYKNHSFSNFAKVHVFLIIIILCINIKYILCSKAIKSANTMAESVAKLFKFPYVYHEVYPTQYWLGY